MSKENGIVDFETDFLPYFREHYGAIFPGPPTGPWTDEILKGYFDFATNFIVANSPTHRPKICWKRRLILYCYLVAHQAALQKRGMGVVGIITSASQGSVSQGTQAPPQNLNFAWLGQTNWGEAFLAAIRLYRGFQFVPSPRCYWK